MTADLNRPIRILGLTTERVANFRNQPTAKNAGLFAALDRRYGVVGVVRPVLPGLERYLLRLRYLHPNRDDWQVRTGLNLRAFQRRTAIAEAHLQRWHGRYDLIMQYASLFAPGLHFGERPYVVHLDNTYILSERHYPRWAPLRGRQRDEWIALERSTYRHAAFLFPKTDFSRRSLIEDYGCDPERVIRVGGGANIVAVGLDGKTYDSQIALFVGYEFERKGGPVLLRAWEAVRRRLPQAQLWIVGPRQPRTPERDGVRWLGPLADRRELSQVYSRAAVFVMPSIFESWGNVFLEAMGHGLPCIGADHCAMPEVIEHGLTGLLVPPTASEPLAEALMALLGDPARAEAMGRRAHASVLHGHTWDDVVARMAPYIEQAVDATASRSYSV